MSTSAPRTSNKDKIIGGQYRIIKELGSGGMGAIYYGIHILTEQPVAIKMLHPSLCNDELVRKRFLSEASVLARMEHPHIVQWKNSIEDASGLYLIMQYIEGDNIESRLEKQGHLSIEDVIAFAIQTLTGLAYVHSKGVVHRDLKPANILLTQDNQVKLADFGIARLTGTNRVTQAGMTIGTFFYMAPEQILGHDSDHRTDIYSMGITMFEMLTGRIPFQGDTEFEVCKQHLESPIPSVRKIMGKLPKKLDTLLSKATAKRPEERFQSAEEFIAAIKIQFPKIAVQTSVLGPAPTALTPKEVKSLIKEYSPDKPKRGCFKSLIWLVLFCALAVGLGYVYYYIIDKEEQIPTKHGRVEVRLNAPNPRASKRLQPPAKTGTTNVLYVTKQNPYKADFKKNSARWPVAHSGVHIQRTAQQYQLQTQTQSKPNRRIILCSKRLQTFTAPIRVDVQTRVNASSTGTDIHGIALHFSEDKGVQRGYILELNPARQRVRLVSLSQGKELEVMPWTAAPMLNKVGHNQIKVVLQEDTFQWSINKTELPPVSDSTHTKGRICMVVQPGGRQFSFSDFAIQQP